MSGDPCQTSDLMMASDTKAESSCQVDLKDFLMTGVHDVVEKVWALGQQT